MTDKEIEALWQRVTGFSADDERADIAGFARALLSASIADTAGAILQQVESILASEIECGVFEDLVLPALETAKQFIGATK